MEKRGRLKKKDQYLLVLGVVAGLLVIGLFINYVATLHNISQSSDQTVHATSDAVPLDTTQWITEIVELKKQTPTQEERLRIGILYPRDWTFKIVTETPPPGSVVKDCFSYTISNKQQTAQVLISPVCNAWSPTYSGLPVGASIVGATNIDSIKLPLARYFDYSSNQYRYVSPDLSNRITEAIPYKYEEAADALLPMKVSFSYTGFETDASVKVADAIVSSIHAYPNTDDANGD